MASRDLGVSYPKHILWYKFFMFMIRTFVYPVGRIVLHLKTKKDKGPKPTPCVMLHNHMSNYDFICTLDIFRPYTRYIISDAMLRSKLNAIVFPIATDFIYRRKGDRADDVVESIKVTLDKGISIGLSPEGGVSPNGTTESVRPRTGQMIKDLNCGMVTIALRGGFFIYPTWARNKSKGPMFGEVVGRYTKEDLADKTPDEINEIIYRDIYVNNYEWNRKARIKYERKNRAEWMERVVGICPKCKTVGSMHSEVDDLYCSECGYRLTVDEYGFLQGDDAVYDNLYDWDMWQRGYLMSQRDKWLASPDEIITVDEHMKLNILRNNFPVLLDEDVRVEMTAKEIRVIGEKENLVMPLDEIAGIIGAITDGYGITFKDEYYQFKASHPIWNEKQRFIRKVLRGEPIKRDPPSKSV